LSDAFHASLSDGGDEALVVALACEIGAEVHRSQGTRTLE
jgi:hypothetical protein